MIMQKIFLMFLFYSFLGWSMEVILTVICDHKFVNRGFLIGPCCPIYGVGAIILIYSLNNDLNDLMGLFLKSILICSILEYGTSYIMERLFNARWWDYHNRKFNINGRICLETMIPFGIGACLILYYIDPFFQYIYSRFDQWLVLSIFIISLVLFIIDLFVSLKIVVTLKDNISNIVMDNTEEIRKKISAKIRKWTGREDRYLNKKVADMIKGKSSFTRRLIYAFPHIKINIRSFKDKVKRKK